MPYGGAPIVELSTIQSIYTWPYKYTVKNQNTFSKLSPQDLEKELRLAVGVSCIKILKPLFFLQAFLQMNGWKSWVVILQNQS